MKDLLFITGSYPPDICGVGDHTFNLMGTCTAQSWEMYYRKNWSIYTLFRHVRDIYSTGANFIIMQYGTRGYGWSIVPHLLCIYYSWFTRKRFGVILHELSQLSLKAYMAELLILISANKIMFTTQYEHNFAIKRILFLKSRSTVIKILSNIKASETIYPMEKRNIDVAYFGQIMPLKGIEKFIHDTAPLSGNIKIVIAGQVPPMFADFYNKIINMCEQTNIQIMINLKQAEVSELLNNTKVVYLPFPDGVSERRGSLFTSMVNGAVVLTTFGKFTTKELEKATINVNTNKIQDILNDKQLLFLKQKEGLIFMQMQMPKDWEEIAESYYNFIKK
jgi:glycosyltransferase involved in cell wall biosynthesis